ncbi:MAG: amino acid permease [Mycoplasma sp.]|nr:amino acid permease [Mycoplasma sp.]
MKVSSKNAAKMGLIAAIIVIFGNVVGIGIFFKNSGIFLKNGYNPWGVLIAWIISSILVFFMALSFAEICSCKTKVKNAGLGGWAESFCGKRFGRWTKIGYPTIYFVILSFACVFFAGEAIVNIYSSCKNSSGSINLGRLTTLFIMLSGLLLFVLFSFLNWKASKFSGKLSQKLSLFKFLPIILVVFLGIIFGILNTSSGLWTQHAWDAGANNFIDKTKPISCKGIIMSIPGILFAFEGYLVIGSISGEIDNAKKNVPLSIIFAIFLISCVNIAITIGCITSGTGNVFELMNTVFAKASNKEKWIQISSTIFSCFIFICIIGVVNGVIFGGIRALQAACDENLLFKSKQIKNVRPNDPLFAGFIYYVIFMSIIILGVGISSIILNTDQIIDGFSEANVTAFYLVYGIIVLGGFINRFTKKVTVNKIKGFHIFSIVGTIGAFSVFGFICLYSYGYQSFFASSKNDLAPWGLFQDSKCSFNLTNLHAGITFWAFIVFIFISPFINDLMIKIFDDKSNTNKLIWQRP